MAFFIELIASQLPVSLLYVSRSYTPVLGARGTDDCSAGDVRKPIWMAATADRQARERSACKCR